MNDVILPKWAATPEDFIIKHREALVCIVVILQFEIGFFFLLSLDCYATSCLSSDLYI